MGVNQMEMDCKSAKKLIPVFLKQRLSGSQITKFTDHMEKCAQCKEELTIQYLATEGINHLENGTSFNLDKELSAFIKTAVSARKSRVKKRILFAAYETVALLIIFGIYVYVYGF